MDISNHISIYNQKLQETEFKRVQEFMLKNLGVKLSPVKIVMVNSRLIKRLRSTGIDNFTDYLDYALSADGKRDGEYGRMIDELTTHKTEFFRESAHYDFLVNRSFPECFEKGNSTYKIWSAGCSSGEEPYTMAMLLNEFSLNNRGFQYMVYASDVSSGVLANAVRAIYNEDALIGMDKHLVKQYFLQSKDSNDKKVRVIKQLRDKVHFFSQNLVDNYIFQDNGLDVIFCRNTLIYFDDKAKREVVQNLIRKIKLGGYLIVGLSETVSQYSSAIKQVQPSVYVKIN